MASWNPAARKVRRMAASLSSQGSARTLAAEDGESVGEAVVAVDARDFFNEIDFALEIETPAGQRDLPGFAAFRSEGAAEGGEDTFDSGGGDAFGVERGSEKPMHFTQRERHGWPLGGALFEGGHAHIDEFALDGTAVGEQNGADEWRTRRDRR